MMAISYKWLVHGFYALQHQGNHDKVIKRVIYELEATDGTYTARVNPGPGWIDFVPVDNDSFVPFEDFTEEMIQAWLDQTVPDAESLREQARLKVEDQHLEPLTLQTAPWTPRG
jgi:hypothetical protein